MSAHCIRRARTDIRGFSIEAGLRARSVLTPMVFAAYVCASDNSQLMSLPAVHAIIPAAGRSRRMGAPKQLIEINGRPMLVGVVETLISAGVDQLIVVTRSDLAARLSLPRSPAIQVVCNDDSEAEMIDSIRVGLAACRRARPETQSADGILVCPGDLPKLTAEDVSACIMAYQQAVRSCGSEHELPIVVATFDGRRGHPLIIPHQMASHIASETCSGGLRGLLDAFPQRMIAVNCKSRGVLTDVDSPADLTRE